MNERERRFFRQVAKTMDNNQLQWVLDHDYPEWEKEIAREELERRKGGKSSE
jgi:NADPH:quinone reductase-like Zn-dependent oxidoreductase